MRNHCRLISIEKFEASMLPTLRCCFLGIGVLLRFYWGYLRITEKKMETTIEGLGFRDLDSAYARALGSYVPFSE